MAAVMLRPFRLLALALLASGARAEDKQTDTVWIIGDLHADVVCARAWVSRTGLVANLRGPAVDWAWGDPSAELVFMGDYVDKGPQARETLEFVRDLTERFPDRVHAILGNHELNLLMDRARRGGRMYLQLALGAAHPKQYAAWLPEGGDVTPTQEALLGALAEVYDRSEFRSVDLSPEQASGSALKYVPADQRAAVGAELAQWQAAYLDGVASGTPLGDWLESRPIAAVVADTVFVHGGVPATVAAARGLGRGREVLGDLNAGLRAHGSESALPGFVAGNPAVSSLVEYRGLHKDCAEVRAVLANLNASRIAVGHTPSNDVRVLCGGKLLAVDSALGRWFRASGNLYCDGDKARSSARGRRVCEPMSEQCEGQITRLSRAPGGQPDAADGDGDRPRDAWRVEIISAEPDMHRPEMPPTDELRL